MDGGKREKVPGDVVRIAMDFKCSVESYFLPLSTSIGGIYFNWFTYNIGWILFVLLCQENKGYVLFDNTIFYLVVDSYLFEWVHFANELN